MADTAQDYWDWRKNLPPVPIFSAFGQPTIAPLTQTGIPDSQIDTTVRRFPDNQGNPPMGPGFAPNVTAPGVAPGQTAMSPPLNGFGNPDPVAKQAASAAQTIANDDYKQRALEALLKNKDFGAALALMVKGMGGGKSTATSSPFHVSPANMGGPKKSVEGAAGAAMQRAMATLEDSDLRVPIKRKGGAQGRYDILARRQNQDLSELLKNLV